MSHFPEKSLKMPRKKEGEAEQGKLPTRLSIEAKASIDFEAKAADGEASTEVPIPRFSMIANTGTPMRLVGWKYPVVLDLAGLSIPSQSIPTRFGHDPMHGVGHTTAVGVTEGLLTASGVISRDTPAAKDVTASAKMGFPWRASVGASADEVEFVKSGESVTVNGQQFAGPLNVVLKSTLGEISFVDSGADGNTVVKVAAMAKDDDREESKPVNDESGTNDVIARVKAERIRQQGIRALVEEALSYRGADIPEIERISAEALEAGASVKDTELALLRATRPKSPAQRRADLPTPKVLEASLCMSLGISDEKLARDRDYGSDVVAQAWPLRNRGLRGTIAAALEASGVRVPHGSRELFNAILENRHIRAEGFSTINLPGILGNVANKVLLDAFTLVETTGDGRYEIRESWELRAV